MKVEIETKEVLKQNNVKSLKGIETLIETVKNNPNTEQNNVKSLKGIET